MDNSPARARGILQAHRREVDGTRLLNKTTGQEDISNIALGKIQATASYPRRPVSVSNGRTLLLGLRKDFEGEFSHSSGTRTASSLQELKSSLRRRTSGTPDRQ